MSSFSSQKKQSGRNMCIIKWFKMWAKKDIGQSMMPGQDFQRSLQVP